MANSALQGLSTYLQPLQNALSVCLTQHRDVCDRQRHTLLPTTIQPSQATDQPRHLRVIDVEEGKVILAPEKCRYVALSYMWERSRANQSFNARTKSVLDPISDLPDLSQQPQTITDSIAVCSAIGERYLWIDALCINQSNPDDVRQQIGQMDRIYNSAVTTIVAANDTDPKEGLPSLHLRSSVCSGSPPDDVLDISIWSTRGWTYQEFVLSRRLLLFTSQGIYFHCAESKTATLHGWELPSIGYDTCWDTYNKSVTTYSKRQLGNKSDTLNAISAVQRIFARYTDDTYLCGLPARQLFYALLWQPLAVAERQRSWPSWSWAGWTGDADYLCAINNPAHHAVERQWGDSSARWGSSGRVFHSALGQLRFQTPDGTQFDIDSYPDDASLKQYFDRQQPGELPSLAPDRPFFETGHLRFKSRTAFLTIAPDTEDPAVSGENPLLRRCRLLAGDSWIGTIFLNPDRHGNYPDTAAPCEFVALTRFRAYAHSISADYLAGLLDNTAGEPKEPAIFPAHHYQAAQQEYTRRFNAWQRGQYHAKLGYRRGGGGVGGSRHAEQHRGVPDPHRGMPYPPEIDCAHVMWIEREGSVVYRKAVGIVKGSLEYTGSSEDEEEFCLG